MGRGSVQSVWDKNGDFGTQLSLGGGGVAGGVLTGGLTEAITDAASITDLRGWSFSPGGSVGEVAGLGAEKIYDYKGQYEGAAVAGSVGVWALYPAEGHGIFDYSLIIKSGNTQEIGWSVGNFMSGIAEGMVNSAWSTGS